MKPRDPDEVIRFDADGKAYYPRENATNQRPVECEHCGIPLEPGQGRVWWCSPVNGECSSPEHWIAGGAHITCMQAHTCGRRALEWRGELDEQAVWRILNRLGRARFTPDVVIEGFDGETRIEIDPSSLSEAQLERYEERAAIMEYDGELDRVIAEREAFLEVAA